MSFIGLLGFVLFLAIGSFAAATPGQSTRTFGGGLDGIDERESSWIAYFDRDAGRFIGGVYVNYNVVQWREDYVERFDTILRGELWRLGKHYWTTLDTNLELEMSGVMVSPGHYYLGLSRSEDGEAWRLVLIDAGVARDERLDAFNIDLAPIAHAIPLELERSEETVEELKIVVSLDDSEDAPFRDGFHGDVRLTVLFGTFRLTTPVQVTPPPRD